MTGTIKTLNSRGFGFITSDNGDSKDIFFHSENVVGTTFNELSEGQAVSFEMSSGPKGPFAADVQVVATGQAAPSQEMPDVSAPASDNEEMPTAA